MNQSSFDFEMPASAPSALARAPRRRAPPGLSPEDMAQKLAQHPDFRVLRRLEPIVDFGPSPNPAQVSSGLQRVLVLDTETTGLVHRTDKIIELAMLLVQVDPASGLPFGAVEVFEGFEDPGMPIPAAARDVTGIDDHMVRGRRLDNAQVEAMLARADLVVAHNAGFDRPFVEARFPGFATKAWACSFADIDWKSAGAASSKLSALAHDQGWFYDAHRAQVDCHALLQVLCKAVGEGASTGLAQLLASASRPSFRLRATGAPYESKELLKSRGYRWDGEARVWHCQLPSQARLDEELVWLKAEVYGRRGARVEIETLDGAVRYSSRPGVLVQQPL